MGGACSAQVQAHNTSTVEEASLKEVAFILQPTSADINIAKDRPILLKSSADIE
jgi:hypothetical protein